MLMVAEVIFPNYCVPNIEKFSTKKQLEFFIFCFLFPYIEFFYLTVEIGIGL